jgi:carbonic anhydrase/acetyltransferase-like protein (isoleucine patch superfamily)
MDPPSPALHMTSDVTFRSELIDPSAFLAPGAVVVGDVTMGAESSLWFSAVIRSDCEAVSLGRRTNVQDGCVLHADPGYPCRIGDGVTIGHRAIVHGAEVGDNVVVGMGAIVLNGARIGRDSIIAAGAVVTEGAEVPPGSLVMGVPGKVRRALTSEEIEHNRLAAAHYVENAKRYAAMNQLRSERPA